MHPRNKTSVLGPYRTEAGTFRVSLITADGQRCDRRFKTEKDALDFKAECEREYALAEAPLEELVERYTMYMKAKGNKLHSIRTTCFRLRALWGSYLQRPLSDLTPGRCKELYLQLTTRQKADSHRGCLSQSKTFWEWCIKEGFTRLNPWRAVEPLGRKNRGKLQLRRDEARRFAFVVFASAQEGQPAAVACLMALVLGLRASEIVGIRVRDLDDGGKVLRIEYAKTIAGERELEIPEVLQAMIFRLAKRAGLDGRLFPYKRAWVLRWTKRFCVKAGVPTVTAHSLRGLHASLATAAGVSSHLVAAALGHTSPVVTELHYTRPEAITTARTNRALTLLPPEVAKDTFAEPLPLG